MENRFLIRHVFTYYICTIQMIEKMFVMLMKSQTHQSSKERCAFLWKKKKRIDMYLRRLIAARIIKCTDYFIGDDADRRSRWAV